MRIACPSCHAEYEVPDAMLAGGGRQLRCARCGHAFAAALPRSAPAAPPAGPPAPGQSMAEPPIPAPPIPTPPLAGPGEPLAAPLGKPQAEGPEATEALAKDPPAKASLPIDGIPAPTPPKPVSAPVIGPDRPPPTRGPVQHSPIDAPQDAPPPPATGRLAAAWLASLALLGAGVAAVLVFHAEIAAAWPPAARFYTVLGLG